MAFESKAEVGVETGAKCPECGTWHAAAALCPRCALSFAMEDGDNGGESDPLETLEGDPAPAPPAAAVPPPEFAHFTVERDGDGRPVELGRGGMGVTYLATDRHLRIKVALKVIAPSRVGDRAAQALFFREARAAAQVRHSHVASVLYLSEPPGNVFYAMEFVPGDSLRRWIEKHAPVPPLLALSLVEQIARGLGAIHHEGIVHRDLKPGNVMLVPAPRSSAAGPMDPLSPDAWHAKIIDFGLARAVAKEDEYVSTIGFRGTALYASPEQCEERHDLDGRADLYSLGCILFELLTGGPPFKARTHRELMNLHVSSAPPLERLEHHPASLTAIVARLLVKDPEDRFADAEALVKALVWARSRIERGEGAATPTSSAPPAPRVTPRLFPAKPATAIIPAPPIPFAPTPDFARPNSKLRRLVRPRVRLVAAGMLALALALALVAGLFWWQARKNSTSVDQPTGEKSSAIRSLAVLPFSSLSSDKENAYFAEGLHAEILSSLARMGDLRVISRLSVERYKPGSERDLRKISAELGVGAVLSGSVQREGSAVRIKLEMVEAATSRVLWITSLDRTLTDLLSLQNEVALEVGERLLPRLSAESKGALMRPVANSAAAYQHFLRARAMMSNVTSGRKDLDEAAVALGSALEADPGYALAHAQLSLLHMLYYAWGRDQTDHRLSLSWRHAEAAVRMQPDLPEANLALGTYFYRGFKDYDRALPYFERVLNAAPRHLEALWAVASIKRRRGSWREATADFLRAGEQSPADPILQYNVANTLLYQRDYGSASRLIEQALKASPYHPALTRLKGELQVVWDGKLGSMRDDLVRRAPDRPTLELFLLDKVNLLCMEGRFDDALAELRASAFNLAEGEATYVPRGMIEAEILTLAGRSPEAAAAWADILPSLRELARQRPQDARIRLAHAHALAGTGETEAARAEARAGTALVSVEKDALLGPIFLLGEATVLRRIGDSAAATEFRDRLLQMPSPYSAKFFDLQPEWKAAR